MARQGLARQGKLMITLCIICGREVDVDLDQLIDDLQSDEGGYVCDECYAMIIGWIIKRN